MWVKFAETYTDEEPLVTQAARNNETEYSLQREQEMYSIDVYSSGGTTPAVVTGTAAIHSCWKAVQSRCR